MTLIVSPTVFQSKAKLKDALDSGCRVTDPSVLAPWSKDSRDLPVGFKGVVTNHPLRTKFAQIEKKTDGWRVK